MRTMGGFVASGSMLADSTAASSGSRLDKAQRRGWGITEDWTPRAGVTRRAGVAAWADLRERSPRDTTGLSAGGGLAGGGHDPVRREVHERSGGTAEAMRQQRQVGPMRAAEVVDEQVRRRENRNDEPEDECDHEQRGDDHDGED